MTKFVYWGYSAATFIIALVLGVLAFLMFRTQQFNGLFMAGIIILGLMLAFVYLGIRLYLKGVRVGYSRNW